MYRSRDKWRVVEAFIADADGNGLPEVTALLESSGGHHLGLFAWMGDRYRERLVTSPLTPLPLSLHIIPVDDDPLTNPAGQQATPAPDLVVLSEEASAARGRIRGDHLSLERIRLHSGDTMSRPL